MVTKKRAKIRVEKKPFYFLKVQLKAIKTISSKLKSLNRFSFTTWGIQIPIFSRSMSYKNKKETKIVKNKKKSLIFAKELCQSLKKQKLFYKNK